MHVHSHTHAHTHTLLHRRATDRDSTVLVVAFISLQLLDSTERLISFYNELYNDKEAVYSGSVLLDSQYLPGDDGWRVGECGTVSTETKSEMSQSSEDGKTFTPFTFASTCLFLPFPLSVPLLGNLASYNHLW